MLLKYPSRAHLERVRPAVIDEDEEYIRLRALDAFSLWALKTDISVTPSLKAHGFWESWISLWFIHNIHEGDFVVDIGANCGYYTMMFEELVGSDGYVVAYEANPVYAKLLERTKQDNRAKYVIENVALSDEPGEVTLSYPGDYTGSASIMTDFVGTHWGADKHIKVPATTLDIDFENMTVPDLVKIDAESAEEVIWNGGKSLWYSHKPPVIVLEYSPTGTYSEDFDKELFEYGHVTRIGYDGKEEKIGPDHLKRLKDWDMLVIRKRFA